MPRRGRLTDPQDDASPSPCSHGTPADVACPQCMADIARRIAGMAAARQAAMPTPLAMGAIQSHELLTAHVAAGFTRAEAMQVVLTVYAVSILKNPPA